MATKTTKGPKTVTLTPAAFEPSNPDAAKNIAKSNKAMEDQQAAIRAIMDVTNELFKALARNAPGTTNKEKRVNFLRDQIAAALHVRNTGTYGVADNEALDLAERWVDAVEAKEKADEEILESLAGQ